MVVYLGSLLLPSHQNVKIHFTQFIFISLIAFLRKHKVDRYCVVQFPKQNDLSSLPEFLLGTYVLAVYPGTAAIYEETVITTPDRDNIFSTLI